MSRRLPLRLLTLALALCAAAGCRRVEVGEAEKGMILRAGDFAAYGYEFPGGEGYERFEKTVYFDGAYEIEYEFEPPEGAAAESPLYLNVVVTMEKNQRDARLSQAMGKFGINAGMGLQGLKLEERRDFFRYGDVSAFYVLTKDGRPVGNYFVTREGAKVYAVVVAGPYFEDADAWAELITPRLQRFSAHKP